MRKRRNSRKAKCIKFITSLLGMLLFCVISTAIVSELETTYSMQATVVEVERDGTVTFEDTTYNKWTINTTDNKDNNKDNNNNNNKYNTNDKVIIKFFNNLTVLNREDDVIKSVRVIQKGY